MVRPETSALPQSLAGAANEIAARLREGGHRGWIVGGTVRDLALGRIPHDLDMASAARPEEVEALFPRTLSVGRAFGTMIVLIADLEVQLTTFRSEGGYSDGRRPDEVSYGTSVEEDAARRDFTCNAMFLDPLDDSFLDPEGGVADLEAGVLRCVGDPAERFAEDGLRLLRMARFAGMLGLTLQEDMLEAARANPDALRGVSPERILHEVERVMNGPGARRAIEVLGDASLLERSFPGLDELRPRAWSPHRLQRLYGRVFGALPETPGAALGFAALLDPAPSLDLGTPAEEIAAREARVIELLERLRPSRDLRARVLSILAQRRAVDAAASRLAEDDDIPRGETIRLVREEGFADGLALARAWALALDRSPEAFDDLAKRRAHFTDAELRPDPFIKSDDLAERGLSPGPVYGRILAEAEALQIDLALTTRDEALAWLDQRVAQDGGNKPRKKKAKG